MRCLIIAVGLSALVSSALAADYDGPVLRGSDTFIPARPQFQRWQGFYFGGVIGYADAVADFTSATTPLVDFTLRNSVIQTSAGQLRPLGPANTAGPTFGAFLGYNIQWDDAVAGIEADYHYFGANMVSSVDPIARSNVLGSNNHAFNILVTGDGSMRIVDYTVLRGRVGWAVDNFLPYATFGAAFGRANVAASATVQGQDTTANPNTFFEFTQSNDRNSLLIYGFAAGVGLDAVISRNIFARLEYEYISFAPTQGISSHINEARIGVGVKY
jgi:opacity protein-like surface antigen